jgi:DNA-binding protein HU-beta
MTTRPTVAKNAPSKKSAAKKPAVATPSAKPATPVPKAKVVAAPVVTLKAVFEQLGEVHGLQKKQALGMQTGFVAAMTAHLKRGDRIRMSGLGILEGKARAARTGRNPATGETIQIKASKKVGFRAAKELKEAI